MANNDENLSAQDTALNQMGKIDVDIIVPPPNNDVSQPHDGFTLSIMKLSMARIIKTLFPRILLWSQRHPTLIPPWLPYSQP